MNITSFHVLGVVLQGERLLIAALSFGRKKIRFQTESALKDNFNVKQLYIDSSSLLVTGLETRTLWMRRVELAHGGRGTSEALAYQIEPHLPCALEEAIIQSVPFKSTTFLTFVAEKKRLQEHLTLFAKTSLSPQVVSCEPMALYCLSRLFVPQIQSVLLHLGAAGTTLLLIKEEKLTSVKYSDLGEESFLRALIADGYATHEEAKAALLNHNPQHFDRRRHTNFFASVKEWQREVELLAYALQKDPLIMIESLIVTGELFSNHAFLNLLREGIFAPLVLPRLKEDLLPTKDLLTYALPIGLALTANPKIETQLNFLPFQPQLQWLKKSLIRYAAAALIFAIALFLPLYHLVQRNESALVERAKHLIQLKQDVLNVEENEKVIPGKEIEQALCLKIGNPYPYALNSNAPTLCEVLAWLGTLAGQGEMQIEKIRYSLVQHPSKIAPREAYVASVDIELFTASPDVTRAIQTKLQDNKMIMKEREFLFVPTQEGCRLSCFLQGEK